ncbi:MAG: heparinase II/III family protein, partial [Victivallaceae bacterium]
MSICKRLSLVAAAAIALAAAAADLADASAPAAVVHPAGPFKAADLERARANLAEYEWAQKLLANYRERAKSLMAIPSDRIAVAIPAEDPWLQCPCPKCGTHADYAWRNGLRPDGESAACAKCGQVIPSADFPEDRIYTAKNLRGEIRSIPYHEGSEPYYGNRRQFLGGLINWLKVSRLYKLPDLAYVYALTGERPYAERTRELLLRFAETYPGYVVRFRTTAFDSPAANYMASHFADWKYQDSVLVANLALAYDLTLSSGLYSDADRLQIENGIFREYGRLITAHAPTRDWCTNAVPAHLTGAALAGAMLGSHRLMSWVLEGQEGFKSFVAANYHRDGNWNENSPSYAVMANEPWWLLLETLSGFSDSPDYRGAGRYDKIDVFAEIPLSRYLFGALDRAVMPDGALPANNDSAFGLTLPVQWRDFAACHFGAPPPGEAGGEYALFKRGDTASGAPSPPPASAVLAGPGWAVLRPPAAPGRTALMLNFGPFVGGHAHDSALSYTYYDFNRELVTDLGYLGYTHPLRPWM